MSFQTTKDTSSELGLLSTFSTMVTSYSIMRSDTGLNVEEETRVYNLNMADGEHRAK
jgi:hypothetical protein